MKNRFPALLFLSAMGLGGYLSGKAISPKVDQQRVAVKTMSFRSGAEKIAGNPSADEVARSEAPGGPSLLGFSRLDAPRIVAAGRQDERQFLTDLLAWAKADPNGPWLWLIESRSKLSGDDYDWLRGEVSKASRFHVTVEFQNPFRIWFDRSYLPSTIFGNASELEKAVQSHPNPAADLIYLTTHNSLGDSLARADFFARQQVGDAEKGRIMDIVLKGWGEKEGFDVPSAWLLEKDKEGAAWNTPRAWIAVDGYAKNPSIAASLLARVDDPVLRDTAVLAIAAKASGVDSIAGLQALTTPQTWKVIRDQARR